MRVEKFPTDQTVELYVEIRGGDLQIEAAATATTVVEVEGLHADEVDIRQQGRTISVVAPRPRGMGGDGEWSINVRVTVPEHSDVIVQSGSAPTAQRGVLRSAQCKAGSGHVFLDEIESETLIDTGSGQISVNSADGDVRLRTGSGGVMAGRLSGDSLIATGSGNVKVVHLDGDLSFKAGSGDVAIGSARGRLSARTGSGNVQVEQMTAGEVDAKTGSGSVTVRVPAGTPVWTDILSGRAIESTLPSAGQPRDGQDHVRLLARTGTGVVRLAPSDT